MSEWIIKTESLGKRYQLQHRPEGSRYVALRDVIADRVRHPFRARAPRRSTSEEFWALKDVSLEIERGDVVGIIGRNGAGKSTLLKVLSRITEPTVGRIRLRGRIASLLEVGTGFHPELTGRENIFMNGAILGMTRAEIRRKFDEIVAFAEVEQFLDTPVKRYSSGMYVRLAFAVAAHLEPEVLVVDEVLAVGDAAFQKKCLGKMHDVADQEGRTVLFVSHNMGAVSQLCRRGVLLKNGGIVSEGPAQDVIRHYLTAVLPEATRCEFRVDERPDLPLQILSMAVTSPNGDLLARAGLWDCIQVRVSFLAKKRLHGSNLAVWVSRDGNTVFESFDTDLCPNLFADRTPGLYHAVIPLPTGILSVGTYTVSIAAGLTSVGETDAHRDVVSFEVAADDEDITHKSYSRQAMVIARLPWKIERRNGAAQ